MVCVDDAHWLDPASADAIVFAARRVRHDRVAVLLAVRDDADRPELRGFEELPLRGLDPTASAELLRTLSRFDESRRSPPTDSPPRPGATRWP